MKTLKAKQEAQTKATAHLMTEVHKNLSVVNAALESFNKNGTKNIDPVSIVGLCVDFAQSVATATNDLNKKSIELYNESLNATGKANESNKAAKPVDSWKEIKGLELPPVIEVVDTWKNLKGVQQGKVKLEAKK